MSDTPTSAMEWKIINNEKAQELHIEVVSGALVINLRDIPDGMSIDEYVKYIKDENIVIKQ